MSPEGQDLLSEGQGLSSEGQIGPDVTASAGIVALVGGAEFGPGCDFDAELAAVGGSEVVVLPTAAAYENPGRAVDTARKWFAQFGVAVNGLMVLARSEAEDPGVAEVVRSARFIYLTGGSPLHLRSVLKATPTWQALMEAWRSGAVVAGSSAGAMVLTDPMVDPRGGAFTLGLGLIEQLAIIPHFAAFSEERRHRTLNLASRGLPVVGIDEATALIRESDGTWKARGAGQVQVFVDGERAGLEVLQRSD